MPQKRLRSSFSSPEVIFVDEGDEGQRNNPIIISDSEEDPIVVSRKGKERGSRDDPICVEEYDSDVIVL